MINDVGSTAARRSATSRSRKSIRLLRVGAKIVTSRLADVSAVQLREQFFAHMRVDEHLGAGVMTCAS